MTPKEKAMHLMCKFYLMNTETGNYICTTLAKQCALLCVDEILNNSRSSIPILIPSNELVCSPEYWQEVKQEIEKL